MTVKEELPHLVDGLDDVDAREALEHLRCLGQDSEPLTDEETARVHAGEARIAGGDYITIDELRQQVRG